MNVQFTIKKRKDRQGRDCVSQTVHECKVKNQKENPGVL